MINISISKLGKEQFMPLSTICIKNAGVYYIGKGNSCHIRMDSQFVSTIHTRLVVSIDDIMHRAYLEDNNSLNKPIIMRGQEKIRVCGGVERIIDQDRVLIGDFIVYLDLSNFAINSASYINVNKLLEMSYIHQKRKRISKQSLRMILNSYFRTDEEFDMLLIDHFPDAYKKISHGMSRLAKENLLMISIETYKIVSALEKSFPETISLMDTVIAEDTGTG